MIEITDAFVEAAAREHTEILSKLGNPHWEGLTESGRTFRLKWMRAALDVAALETET